MAFLLTTMAGLATTLGSMITCFVHKDNMRFLAGALGFAAGVMIYVSFMDILPEAFLQITTFFASEKKWYVLISFLLGMVLVLAMECLLPEPTQGSLLKTGNMTAFVIALHNFPEGMATFTTTLANPILGISVACAIALHNIPEGIAVSVPLYYAYGNRKKAVFLSFLSGLSEPLGALCAFALFRPFLNGRLLGILLAFVAGIMVFISLCELLPNSIQKGHIIESNIGLIAGMSAMAIGSLIW